MAKRISRRDFLKILAAVGTGAGVALVNFLRNPFLLGDAQSLTGDGKVFLPFIRQGSRNSSPTPTTPSPEPTAASTPIPPSTGSRVVHVHSNAATSWNGADADYWNYVDQSAVNNMVYQGMLTLTGESNEANAWHAIFPDYQIGQGIAIKVNLNNAGSCSDTDGQIDALIQIVNSIVRGLKQIGVEEADIWVYEAQKRVMDRFKNGTLYNGVRFFGTCTQPAGFLSNDPDAYVSFHPPAGTPMPNPVKITDVLINSTYIINMPIMKPHRGAGITLSFKNHFGSIDHPEYLHEYMAVWGAYYSSSYNPLIDLYKNPHILGKTVLTIGDGLFASKDSNNTPPSLWNTFGNRPPNSLYFATDPVAIDSVMCDFLAAETKILDMSDDYLVLANSAGLGVFEHGDPWGSGYNSIAYQKIEL